MPTLKDPTQQIPPSSPPLSDPNPFIEHLKSQGYQVGSPIDAPSGSSNPFADVLLAEVGRQKQGREHPFATFFGDAGRMLKTAGKDLLQQPVPGMPQEGQTSWQEGISLREAIAMHTTERNVNLKLDKVTSVLDLVGLTFSSGLTHGATMGLDHLPFVGETVEAKMAPVLAQRDAAAAQALRGNIEAMQGTAGKMMFAEVPAIIGSIAGGLTGAVAAFKPFMLLGKTLMGMPGALKAMSGGETIIAAIKANQAGFIGDVAGFGLFGAMTEERGVVNAIFDQSKTNQGLAMEVGDEAPFWQKALVETWNRGTAGAQMAAEGFAIETVFSTLKAINVVSSHRRAQVAAMRKTMSEGTVRNSADFLAMARASVITDPASRKFIRINDASDASLVVDLRASDELIHRSAKAMQLLQEQQSVEGIVSYQSGIAALATAVYDLSVADHATTAVLRGIDDPYRMYSEVFNQVAERLSHRPNASLAAEAAEDTRRLGLLRTARADLEGAPIHRTRATDRAITELETKVKTTNAQAMPQPEILPVKKAPVPLVHAPSEVPGEALFGYVEGAGKPGQPLYLRNRPNITAADLGKVEEAVVLPGKMETFPDYNTMLEKFGSLEDAYKNLKKRGVDTLIIERGGALEREIIVLDHAHIKSSRPVTPDAIAATPAEGMSDAEMVMKGLANEPLEVALSKKMPDFIFETPIKREDGTYDIVFRKRGSPGMSNKQRKEMATTGFFTGQNVLYAGKMYEVAGATAARLKIKNPSTGKVINVTKGSVFDFPSANVTMPVNDALFGEFKTYFDKKLGTIYDRNLPEQGLRDIALGTDNPFAMKRDLSGQASDIMMYPDEILTQAELSTGLSARLQQVQAEIAAIPLTPATSDQLAQKMAEFGEIQQLIKSEISTVAPPQGPTGKDLKALYDDAYVTIPDPLDYYTIIFKRFLQEKDIKPVSGGELDALKFSFAKRLQGELLERLPKDLREHFTKLSDELELAWSKIAETPENKAHMAGFELIRDKQGGFILHRPGSTYYEGIYNTPQALDAALNRALRYGGAPNLTPQFNYLDFSMPAGPGLGATPGAKFDDMHFLLGEDAMKYVAGTKNAPLESTKSKPRWAIMLEEESGIPLWTEHLEPMFTGHSKALNSEQAMAEPFAEAFKGLDYPARKGIHDFIQTIESQAEFMNMTAVAAKAKAAGLTPAQIGALKGMRSVMDDMFALGMKWYNWAPSDYIFNYATRMRPQHLSRMSVGRDRMYDFLPKDMDIFMSKHQRTGMLANIEDDPLVYGLKYIRTFMHEHYVSPSYERLRNFVDIKIKDLPPGTLEKIEAMHPAGVRSKLEADDYALPNAIRGPLNEMLLYARGRKHTQDDIVTKMIKGAFSSMGAEIDSKIVAESINTMMTWHYGATLAGRPKPVVRNTVSNMMTLGPRLDFSSMGVGFERAFKPEAFAKALDEGLVNVRSRGVHLGEEFTQRLLDEAPITGRNAWLGGLFRSATVDGSLPRLVRRMAEKGLSGISNTDQFSRIWAAESQEVFIRPYVEKFLNGKVTEDAFRAKGLRYWEKPIQDKFMRIMERDGSEKAISYIRKEASDITNYVYGAMANPAWAQTSTGRMAYAYGTWGFWWKDLMFRNMRGARNVNDVAAMAVKYGIVAGGISAVGLQLGVDMKSWLAHNSVLRYGGGPLVQVMSDAVGVMEAGSWQQKTKAAGELVRQNILRNAFPGQLLINDIGDALDQMPYPDRAMSSFMLGRHTDDMRAWGLDVVDMYNSSGALGVPTPQTPPR